MNMRTEYLIDFYQTKTKLACQIDSWALASLIVK